MLGQVAQPACVKARKVNETCTGSNENPGHLSGTVVAQIAAGGRAVNPEEVYENGVHSLSYRSLARF